MAPSHFGQFLEDATYQDQESDSPLGGDAFYGLYTSWCCITGSTPQPEQTFWEAMAQRVRPGRKLRSKGPAAADYILNSYQAVV